MLTKDIAEALSGRLDGDGGINVDRLVHPARAERPSDLAIAMSAEAAASLGQSKARAVVVSAKRPVRPGSFPAIIAVDDARTALAKLTALFDPGPCQDKGVHPTAVVAADAKLGAGVSIGAHVVIGARSRIGAGTKIMPQVTIGADVAIGAQGLFHSGVRIGDGCTMGDRVIIHANAVIGADGFSFAPDLMSATAFTAGVQVTRVHSLGNVVIGDDVEIGACTTIDRATLETTRVGSGTKIDDHVHIGHNVTIGENCIVCGMVGISGSVVLGDRVRLGGGVGIADHVRIGDEAVVGAASGVGTNVPAGAFLLGYPAIPYRRFVEQQLYLGRQKRLHDKVQAMLSRLDAVEGALKK
ncbi:MAG TPA: UDP-3-O-(3-hydroxymyristoyl)glucosamine N-acyltransferase [Xanthobacteraceae bacterium]|nr:UDP-3-O-(3-hydroxymyristoyl)glucosamine N-acyltransferase [Xanthobacteraceae bacterium]